MTEVVFPLLIKFAETVIELIALILETCANKTTVVTPIGVVYTVEGAVVKSKVVVLNVFNGIAAIFYPSSAKM